MNKTDRPSRGFAARVWSAILRGVLPLVIVVVGGFGAVHLVRTAPEAEQKPRRAAATPVQIRRTTPATEQVVIQAMGTVIAAKEVVLQPQVSGVVQDVHPALKPGGRITAGEELVRIDSSDYKVAMRQAEAALARAEAERQNAEFELRRVLALEERQATNEKELNNARTAVAATQADFASRQAALEKAKLDLSRTTLRAPFSCLIVDEDVDVGSLVTPQTPLATLVGTDEYWVQAALPVEQLRWIHAPAAEDDAGSAARVTQRLGTDEAAEWDGRVVRLLGDLEPQGRMARVLISIMNPLGTAGASDGRPPLLIGSYVDVAIAGREIRDVVAVKREELRDGDTVWIMNGKDQLEIRKVELAYRGREQVLVRHGLPAGERLITTDLPSPVPGMSLREIDEGGSPTEMATGADPANTAENTP